VEAQGGGVTRHGRVIAVLLSGSGTLARHCPLVARGLIRLKATTTSDLDRIPRYVVSSDASPLDLLLTERAEDDRSLVTYDRRMLDVARSVGLPAEAPA
jgi:hypothetical protein